MELRNKISKASSQKIFDIELNYITSRGNWYFNSWKGNEAKSGGIATNIGVHFFDMLQWIFGSMVDYSVSIKSEDTNAGTLTFERARVKWYLSINSENLPNEIK